MKTTCSTGGSGAYAYPTYERTRIEVEPEYCAGKQYRIINFIADLPARVDSFVDESIDGFGNIVFVLTDDQFPGSEEHMPKLNTEIVSKGVEFENMTSTFPLCCPGRATIQLPEFSEAFFQEPQDSSRPFGSFPRLQDPPRCRQVGSVLAADPLLREAARCFL